MTAEKKLEALAKCIDSRLQKAIADTDVEIKFQSDLRKRLGKSWSEYACIDTSNVTQTISIANKTWTDDRKKRHKVEVLFESDFNKIQLVKTFVSASECKALKDNSKASGDSSVLPFAARSASMVVDGVMKRAEYLLAAATEKKVLLKKDPIFKTNLATRDASEDCSVDADGSATCKASDAMTAVQPERYLVEGADDLASLLIVCETPTKGGQIYFPKTGTVILPEKELEGTAILVLHENGGTREKDPFVDEYVICPVQEGSMLTFAENMSM